MNHVRLQAELTTLTNEATEQFPGAQLSVAVCDLRGDILAAVNPDAEYEALSLAKLGIILAGHRTLLQPYTSTIVQGADRRDGGPLAHFVGEQVTVDEAEREVMLVSGNTGSKILTRLIGGPAEVNRALGDFTVAGLRTVDGSKTFTDANQPYTHGLITASEAARLFLRLTKEDPGTRYFLARSNDTAGLRRDIDPIWGDGNRPEGTEHPADALMRQIEEQADNTTGEPLGHLLEQLLKANWERGPYPSKSGIDDDPETGISARHGTARIGNLVVATLTAYPYDEQHPAFPLDKGHPAHDFQAKVGSLMVQLTHES